MGRITPYIYWKIKNVWNHQPEYVNLFYGSPHFQTNLSQAYFWTRLQQPPENRTLGHRENMGQINSNIIHTILELPVHVFGSCDIGVQQAPSGTIRGALHAAHTLWSKPLVATRPKRLGLQAPLGDSKCGGMERPWKNMEHHSRNVWIIEQSEKIHWWRWVNTWIGDMFGTSFEPKVGEWYSQYIIHDIPMILMVTPRFHDSKWPLSTGSPVGARNRSLGKIPTVSLLQVLGPQLWGNKWQKFILKHSQRRCRIYRWFAHQRIKSVFFQSECWTTRG